MHAKGVTEDLSSLTEAIRDLTRSATAPRQRQAPQRRKPAQEPPQEG